MGSFNSFGLPPLEIEVFEEEKEEKAKEGDNDHVQVSDKVEVAVLEAKVALQELPHCQVWLPRHKDQLCPIAQLREREPVNRPCCWVCPVHPPPPHRDQLYPHRKNLFVRLGKSNTRAMA